MEKNLSILFLDTRPVRRGAQVFIHELKKQFDQSGITVRRIYLYREDIFECLQLDDKDRVLDFRDNHWMEKWLFFQPALYKKLSHEIQDFNPDIILCNGSRTLKYAALVKRFSPDLKAKWIYRVIDSAKYWNNKTLITLIYRLFIIPAMDAAIGVSNKSLKEMVQHYRFDKPTISIPRALDIGHFTTFEKPPGSRAKLGINEQAFVVLFLGNFTHQKRPDRFIEIIAEVKKRHPHVHGLMVGDGPLKKQMEHLSQQLYVDKNITFAGYQQDVRSYIDMSDILMLTSDTEGMPGVILEAAAMGKISISGPVGGVKEFIINDENGIVLTGVNYHLFSEKLIDVISNTSKYSRMGLNAKETVSKDYAIGTIFLRYLDFFKFCLSRLK
jgi:glycosyltransferase involved in cell wall biosynthesis